MKKAIIILVLIGAIIAGFALTRRSQNTTVYNNPNSSLTSGQNPKGAEPMRIQSPAFENGQPIPKKYSCDGDGYNPPLRFSDIPSEAKSLALIVEDPDAPSGNWVHWLVWNINPSTNEIAENSVPPQSVQGKTSSGNNAYGGPCPPSGTHHYYFRLYALDDKLSVSSFSEAAALRQAMNGHVITQAELMGTYSR